MDQNPKVTIGIVSFNDIKYLEKGLPNLLSQTYKNIEVIICDNNPNLQTTNWLKKNHPAVQAMTAGGNVGFGQAHNALITKAIQNNSTFYLAFNSDIYPTKNFIQKLIDSYQDLSIQNPDKKIAALNPKLLRWTNFPKKPEKIKENIIDTTGLKASPNHYFEERGNGAIDKNKYDKPSQIWGVSGAAPLFKIEALRSIQHSPEEFFDNNFFMYKEDIDLSYRLLWAGYSSFYTPQAIAWHDRTGSNPGNIIQQIKARKKRPNYIQEKSFMNQLMLLKKNWSKNYSFNTKIRTIIHEIKIILYLLLFNKKTLKTFKKLKSIQIPTVIKTISPKQMEKYLSNKFN